MHGANTNAFRSGLGESELSGRLLEEMETTIRREGPETIAAIFAEPLQNAGGCFVPPPVIGSACGNWRIATGSSSSLMR